MKDEVKERIIKENLPIWKNNYPLNEMLQEDIYHGEGRVIVIDNKVVAYACFHKSEKEYEKGMFKKDNLMSFSRIMVCNEYVGKHIGDFLVKNMILESKSLNKNGLAIAVDACNIKALNLYSLVKNNKSGVSCLITGLLVGISTTYML